MADFVWTGATSVTWATGSNWKVAGVVQAAPPTNADRALLGTGTGATNNNCTAAAADVCGELFVDDAYSGTLVLTSGFSCGGPALGAFRLGTGMAASLTGNPVVNMVATSTNGGAGFSVTLNGKAGTIRFTFNGVGGKWKLQDDWTTTNGNGTAVVNITNGTVDFNGKSVTRNNTSSGPPLTVAAGGAVDFSLPGTVLTTNHNGGVTMLSLNAACTVTNGANATLVLSNATANTHSIDLNGKVFGTIQLTSLTRTGALAFLSSGTIKALSCASTSGHTVRATAGITITLSQANALTLTTAITITSITPGSFWSLSSTFDQSVTGISITDSHATGGGYFVDYGGTSVSGNAGWHFPASAIGDTSDERWSVRTTLGDESDERWTVRALIGDTSDERWSVRTTLGDESDERWTVRALATDSTDLRWAVAAAVAASSDERWAVAAAVAASSSIEWAVRLLAGDELDVRWAIAALVASTTDERWTVRALLATDAGLEWAVAELAGSESSIDWSILTTAGASSALEWAIAALVDGDLDLEWQVRELLADELDLEWGIGAIVKSPFIPARSAIIGPSASSSTLDPVPSSTGSSLDPIPTGTSEL